MNKKFLSISAAALMSITALFCHTSARADEIGITAEETVFNPLFNKGSRVDLTIKHSSGKRAGHNKINGNILSELLGSCYAEQQGSATGSKVTNLAVAEPIDGKYILFVEPGASGVYLLQADIMVSSNNVSGKISGLAAGGDVQEIEIEYWSAGDKASIIRKKVDISLLKRELEVSVKKGRLDKSLGKELVKELIYLERALAGNTNGEAINITEKFIAKLTARQESFSLNSQKDIESWFADVITGNTENVQEIFDEKNDLFLNITNIKNNKKSDWYEARSISILVEDANILLENIKNKN